jgi:hypothetical protein
MIYAFIPPSGGGNENNFRVKRIVRSKFHWNNIKLETRLHSEYGW